MRQIDLASIQLTPEIVKTYQDLYYEHYKPLVKLLNPNNPKNFSLFIKEFSVHLKKYNWTWPFFEALLSIDFMQRLVYDLKLEGHKMKSYPEYRHLDPNFGALRLKCLKRTEMPDTVKFH